MIPGMNDVMSPDMQKILLFLLPALAAISALVMTITRGSSIPGIVTTVVFTGLAIYFAPGFFSLF